MTRQFTGRDLVIATHNEGKVAEFMALLDGMDVRLTTAADHGLPAPDETGTTFIENARIKALAAATATGLPALADDSGLCVDILGGAPGVYTADWAGEPRDWTLAMRKVHDAIQKEMPADATWLTVDRRAQFVAVIALAWPDGHVEWAEGIAPGTMVWPSRGLGGHGFDPMFKPDEDARVYGEMSPAEKNAISHRARALAAMRAKCFAGLR